MVKRFVRRVDDLFAWVRRRAHPGARRVVLFDVRNSFGFDAQAPVIRQLLARGSVGVEITSGCIPATDLVELLARHWFEPGLIVPPSQATHRRYDVRVITDTPSVPVWRTTKPTYLHHGSSFGNRADPYAFEMLRDGNAEYLFCLSAAEASQCVAAFGEIFRNRAVVTGQPKLDALVAGRYDRAAFLKSLDLDPGRKTVLLSSHWMPDSLFRSCELGVLRDYFAAAELNLLVTAHYHLFDIASARFSANIDWLSRLNRTFDGPRMRVLRRVPDNRPLLWSADLLIGDQSSIHLEYAVLFRPMILYRSPQHSFSDPVFGRALAAAAALVASSDAMPALIERALGLEPIDRDARQRLLDYCFAYLGRSGERVAQVVESLAKHGAVPETP